MLSINAKKLSFSEIIEAQKLACEVLVNEQKWEIAKDNPSQLRVDGGMLCDKYDAQANWFGVYEGKKLIGCHRHCGRIDGKFEFEHYNSLPAFITEDKTAVEGTRLAIAKEYRRTMALLILVHFEYSYLKAQNYKTLFTTGTYPNPGKMYVEKFSTKMHEMPFKYNEHEPQEVYLYYIDSVERYDKTIERLGRVIDRASRRKWK